MKQNILLLSLIVVVVVILADCQGGPTMSAAVEAAEVTVTTPSTVDEELVLITSAGQVKRIGETSVTEGFSMAGPQEMLPYEVHLAFDLADQGYSRVGLYEMQTLANGEVAIRLDSEGCDFSLDAADAVYEEAAAITDTMSLESDLIISAEYVQGMIGQASLTQGLSMVGFYEMKPLPKGEVAIKLKTGDISPISARKCPLSDQG